MRLPWWVTIQISRIKLYEELLRCIEQIGIVLKGIGCTLCPLLHLKHTLAVVISLYSRLAWGTAVKREESRHHSQQRMVDAADLGYSNCLRLATWAMRYKVYYRSYTSDLSIRSIWCEYFISPDFELTSKRGQVAECAYFGNLHKWHPQGLDELLSLAEISADFEWVIIHYCKPGQSMRFITEEALLGIMQSTNKCTPAQTLLQLAHFLLV